MENAKALEILKMGILLEKRGREFYKSVAEKTDVPEIANIFNIMAEEEIQHIHFLSEQYKNFEKTGNFTKPDSYEEDPEEIANMVLSKEVKEKINAASFEAAAIAAAINMENKAVEIYSERAKSATDPNEKALYQMLADWEKTHHKILADLDKELREAIWFDNSFWPH